MRIYARALFLSIVFRRLDARLQTRSCARWRVRLRFCVLPWNKWQRRQSQKRDGQLPNTEQGVWGAFHPNCIAITA